MPTMPAMLPGAGQPQNGPPVSMLPDAAAIQQSQYQNAVSGSSAATQSSDKTNTKPAETRKWVWPSE
jgi:hypothetical protein